MAKKKSKARKKYDVKNFKFGKEIRFFVENQPINWLEFKEIVEKEFADFSDEDLLILDLDNCSLIVGTDAKQTK